MAIVSISSCFLSIKSSLLTNISATGTSINIEDDEYKMSERVSLMGLFPCDISNLFTSSTVLKKQ